MNKSIEQNSKEEKAKGYNSISLELFDSTIKQAAEEIRGRKLELPKKEDYPISGDSSAYWELNRQVTGFNEGLEQAAQHLESLI